MLSVPAHSVIDDLTIYADDTLFWRFYPVPATPKVRNDAAGEPVLLLLSYALSEQERTQHPELPPGGGYLSFDTTLEPTGAALAAARAALQPTVDAEWKRLRAGTEQDKIRPGVAGTTRPPAVEFATPTWTAGSVTLDAPQSDRLISARIAAGAPSLLAGNVASFSLDLTADGASVLEQALQGGQTVPLQVGYDLSFWARLPSARIYVQVDAAKMHEYIHKQLAGRGIHQCTTYDYDHSDITQESLVLSGAVTVQIDTGSGSLPDDVIAELRGYAFDTLKTLVASTFFQPAGPPATPPALPPPGGAPAGVMPRSLYRFRPWSDPILQVRTLNEQTMSVRLDLEQSSVVAWQVHPRATLSGLFADPEQRKRHVRRIALNDPFFADLHVETEVFADYTTVERVDVELEHSGTDGNGAPRHEATVLTFTSLGPQSWSVPLFGDEPTYRYRYRVALRGGQLGAFTDWNSSDSRRLVLSPARPGLVHADVVAGAVDFDRLVAAVQVTFGYEDPTHGVPREERTVVLTKQMPVGSYRRLLGVAQQAPLQYRMRFDLLTGDVVNDGQWHPVLGEQVIINQPTESVLRVSLLPTGNGWADVVAVMVDLRHEDPDGHVVTDTFALRSMQEFQTWQVYLRDRTARAYRYRWTASFADGRLLTQDWRDNPGDPVLPVLLQRSGIDVLVVADALDFAACPLTEVSLRWLGPTTVGGTPPTTTLLFRGKTPQVWHVAVPDGSPAALAWTVTHYPADRDPVALPERVEHDPVVVLPAYRATTAGELRVQVIASLVDFAATPVVGVDLSYDDPANGVHAETSLTFGPDRLVQFWTQPTKDARLVNFRYQITYFDRAGHPHQGVWTDETVPRVVIPAAG